MVAYRVDWLPEVDRRHVLPRTTPEIPKSLKYLRALLLIMAVLLALNTLGRMGTVQLYGVSPVMSPVLGVALLAIVGFTFVLAYFGVSRPATRAKAA